MSAVRVILIGGSVGSGMGVRGVRRLVMFVLVVGAGVLAGPVVAGAQAASVATVTHYTGPGINNPQGIAAGPDGALWFTNFDNNSIGRITTTGTVTNYTGPGINSPAGIAAGPDGALWFTNFHNNSIGRITTTGTVTDYTAHGISSPSGIAAGPDGDMWFTNRRSDSIGRISTTGTVTNYTDASILAPFEIAAGSDGALWFTDFANDAIGRITTTGTVTEYTDPSISFPDGIAAGPDGALWFTNSGSIGRISTTGTVTNYTGPGISFPNGIAAGPDGALWFTNSGNDSIGRITTTGTVTNYTDASMGFPDGIVAGPDGALWFTNQRNNSIGRIQPSPYATAVASTPGVLAYWRLGESSGTTARDVTGAHNGTYRGGHTLGVPGALKSDPSPAVALDGSSGHVRLPSLGTEPDWTVEGWTHLNAGASRNYHGNNALYASLKGVRLLIRPTGVYADDRSTGTREAIVQRRTASNVGSWVYWALVRHGPTLTIYRNATVVASGTLATPGVHSALNGAIGATAGDNSYHLHGTADEVAVYKHALTPATLLSHYHLAGYATPAPRRAVRVVR